jgi:hypothetical protein
MASRDSSRMVDQTVIMVAFLDASQQLRYQVQGLLHGCRNGQDVSLDTVNLSAAIIRNRVFSPT